jgi:hypothetical protein
VGAGQVQILADRLDEETSRFDVELVSFPVDRQGDVFAHGPDLLRRRSATVGTVSFGLPDGAVRMRRPLEHWGLAPVGSS